MKISATLKIRPQYVSETPSSGITEQDEVQEAPRTQWDWGLRVYRGTRQNHRTCPYVFMYTPHTGANHVHYAHIPLADSVLKFGVAHAGSSPWTKFFFVQSKEYLRNKAKRQKWIDQNFIWPTNNSLLLTCLWLETLTLCAHMLSVLIGYFRKLHKTVQQTNGDSESSHVHQL